MASTEGQQSLVKLMTGIVLLTGGLVALSWLATNPQEESASLGAIARAPASLVGMALVAPKATAPLLERTTLLDFECTPPETTTVAGDIHQLRIRGKFCETSGTQFAEVLNLTNGFTATVFTPTPNTFTSDYIHLADGPNRLRVTYVLSSGERRVREFAVNRP